MSSVQKSVSPQEWETHYQLAKAYWTSTNADLKAQLAKKTADMESLKEAHQQREVLWAARVGARDGQLCELRALLEKREKDEQSRLQRTRDFWATGKESNKNGKGGKDGKTDKTDQSGKGGKDGKADRTDQHGQGCKGQTKGKSG